jgi:hypothetical protein
MKIASLFGGSAERTRPLKSQVRTVGITGGLIIRSIGTDQRERSTSPADV